MSKRILVVGAGANHASIIRKARELGLYTVAADSDPDAPGCRIAEEAEPVDIADADEVARVARKHQVDGLYPAAGHAVETVAQAANALGLPGLTPLAAARVSDRLAVRQALQEHAIPVPRFMSARSSKEAEAAAQAIGTPALVMPADTGGRVTRVDYLADVSLAFDQARRHASSDTVLLEEYLDGDAFCVDALIHEGGFVLGGIARKERSTSSYQYDTGIVMPASVDTELRQAVIDLALQALAAIGFTLGAAHIDILVTPDGPRVVDIACCPEGVRVSIDLVPLACGMDFLADSLCIAVGEPPQESPQYERSAAILWIPCGSGIVTDIQGVDEAAAIPGIQEVTVAAKPGDVMQHIVDCATRDKVGYVIAAGDNAQAARDTAQRARDTITINTRTSRD